uniref:EF-hand domain-containing protein n=1 Tax=Ditylenchus dipsaci TaxID=166011 RepID=A0A915D2W0_9BILA
MESYQRRDSSLIFIDSSEENTPSGPKRAQRNWVNLAQTVIGGASRQMDSARNPFARKISKELKNYASQQPSFFQKHFKRTTPEGGDGLGYNKRRKSISAYNHHHHHGDIEGGKSGLECISEKIHEIQGKFAGNSSEHGSDDGGSGAPLITKLDKYTAAELKEYRQVFNMFDADRSGAIGLDEMENALTNLGMDPKQIFCEVMKATSEKTQSWNEVIKECFSVFDRSESGLVSRKDFEFILREVGDIHNSALIEELFTEYDVDYDGFIDFDEFSFLVKNYLTDEDVV